MMQRSMGLYNISRLAIPLVLVIFFSGCSRQYSLERRIYKEGIKVSRAVLASENIPDLQYKALMESLDELEKDCKDRNLELPVIRYKALLYAASSDLASVDKLLKDINAFQRKLVADSVFLLLLKKKNYDIAMKFLDIFEKYSKEDPAVKDSLPFLRCFVGLKKGEKGLCSEAIDVYSSRTNLDDPKERFVGWRGLFLTYSLLGDRDRALSSLNSIVNDEDMPIGVVIAGLRQEMGILLAIKDYSKIKELLENFLVKYSDKVPPESKQQIKDFITLLEKRAGKEGNEENLGLPNR